MFKIPKQEYTVEFKELVVKRVVGGESFSAVAKEWALVEQTLRNWVKASKEGRLSAPGGKTVTPEERVKLEKELLDRLSLYKKQCPYTEKNPEAEVGTKPMIDDRILQEQDIPRRNKKRPAKEPGEGTAIS